MSGAEAFRATVRGRVQGVGFRAATIGEAKRLGVLGWVRNTASGEVQVHAEGEPEALRAFVAFLGRGPAGAAVEDVALAAAKPEGHEQFAMRGVPAGRFRVVSEGGQRAAFVLTLEVAGGVRAWRLPRPPSMVPAEKRFATLLDAVPALDGAEVWDEGAYEQGGRVPWPEAIERGHAVFVLHGARLQGGFALQRTGRGWLLVKRRDEHAAG